MTETKNAINLKTEYTDAKDIKHRVEHFIVPNVDDNSRERVVKELFYALTKTRMHGRPAQ